MSFVVIQLSLMVILLFPYYSAQLTRAVIESK